jgi:hypothetical protein
MAIFALKGRDNLNATDRDSGRPDRTDSRTWTGRQLPR